MDKNLSRTENKKSASDVQSKGYNPSYPIISDNRFIFENPVNSGMKVDPYKIKDKYLNWKRQTDSGIPDISPYNSTLMKKYLEDMENGMNVSSATKRGGRSYVRLNVLRQRMVFVIK